MAFERHPITVRRGNGDKDRVTLLPAMPRADLRAQLAHARAQHDPDRQIGAGWVELPDALQRKLPRAGHE